MQTLWASRLYKWWTHCFNAMTVSQKSSQTGRANTNWRHWLRQYVWRENDWLVNLLNSMTMHLSKHSPSNHYMVIWLWLWLFATILICRKECLTEVSIALMSHKQHVVRVLISTHPSPFPKIFRPTLKLLKKIWTSRDKVHPCNLPHKSLLVVCHRLILFWEVLDTEVHKQCHV